MAKEFDEILDDVFDLREVIARYEEIEDSNLEFQGCDLCETPEKCKDDAMCALGEESEEQAERRKIAAFLEEVKGYGGDEQWRGDWYPVTFIRDSHFEDYARELADDIGAIDKNAGWPMTCIDWERAARELQQDYSSVEIDGVTYWYRRD